ncbi:unnamed protein product [Scytosiphon promiscuus]
MASTDRDALLTLYNLTGGARWRLRWDISDNLSLWLGVLVRKGRVVELIMSFNKLRGPIPKELGALTQLEQLCLFQNQLKGTIPRDLAKLKALRVLNLAENGLTGTIPKELGTLTALRELSLIGNSLSGPIPPELGNLSALEVLNLRSNQLSGPIPPELGNLRQLQLLWLDTNQLTGSIPKELGELSMLETLGLSSNKLTGFVPAQLVCLRLRALLLGGNHLRGPVPSIGQLRNLRRALASPRSRQTGIMMKSRMRAATDRILNARKGEPARSSSTKTTLTLLEQEQEQVEARAGDGATTVIGDKISAISGLKGPVVAWSIGRSPNVLRCPDDEFEVEVPDLSKNIPALIGLHSSLAEVVDGSQCLLHPVLTCLAREGEVFDPPLFLRFPVGDLDAMESGSDGDSAADPEVAYRAHLESSYSVLTREDECSEWVRMKSVIKRVEGGVFVLEVTVSHFCDFALKRNIEVGLGCVELVKLNKLKHGSRQGHFHFVNLGTEELVVYGWASPQRRNFVDSFKLRLGFGFTGGNVEAEGTRTLEDVPNGRVNNVSVHGGLPGEARHVPCLVVDDRESLTVAHVTQERVRSLVGSTHTLVQVWGSRSMQHKHAMVFGPLPAASKCLVSNLRVEDGGNVGKIVKSTVE